MVCEGAWTGAKASAGPQSGSETSLRRWESDGAPRPLRSVTKPLKVSLSLGEMPLI